MLRVTCVIGSQIITQGTIFFFQNNFFYFETIKLLFWKKIIPATKYEWADLLGQFRPKITKNLYV
jgi:hypothetical protein